MKLAFQYPPPPEQLTAEFWEDERLGAMAEWLLEQMDKGRIEPPDMFNE